MTKDELLFSVVESAVARLSCNNIENILIDENGILYKAGLIIYPEAKSWTPDKMAKNIQKDLNEFMHNLYENLFEN